ncbi:MAG: hypothetical protein E6I47_06470 [Chloroflexi bacterium]|nr:MAG: hypothetical protein E6J07_01600 [Chloroflexota bacterium]TME82208.1 MAG: hypothetical protein E6I47_06470 [Chloroflexota bacterium]TMF92924.1 MAG: hypothetical protein E6I10_13655 [Chloroflexota bacterium]
MFGLTQRLNAYSIRHPWRTAAIGFLFFVILSVVLSLLTHRSFYGGLFGAYGVAVGLGAAWSTRRQAGAVPFWRKALVAPLFVLGFLVLGLLLQVTGQLPR